MVIDCHGHYTTAPKELQAFRDMQIAALKNASAPAVSLAGITDDQLRVALEASGATPEETASFAASLRTRITQLESISGSGLQTPPTPGSGLQNGVSRCQVSGRS